MPFRWRLRLRPSQFIYTVRPCLIHKCHGVAMPFPCHATTMLFWKRPLKATAQRGMRGAWCVWISNGRPETTCGRPARVRLLPATTRSSTKVVTRSRLAVRIFPSTKRTFMKDTALSENDRFAAWHMWINAAGKRHGNGMVCELALRYNNHVLEGPALKRNSKETSLIRLRVHECWKMKGIYVSGH
jgi:hypothetical protein